ncbi:MAG: 16S rRNA (uracil(1498)-N(3))-methyltransferase [Rhodobacteraceae bacterium]|nr:16S rRNA (uracil(1498)-N(3))-methyltransferase [Paracoccaceae bacterium]
MTTYVQKQRLFVETDLADGATIAVSGPQAHYLLNVMRMKAGDTVTVFNGRDGEWAGEIVLVKKKECHLKLIRQARVQTENPDIWLAFAPIKKARIDLIAEKSAELGTRLIWPVITQRTNAERVNLVRLRANAVEAAEQCGLLAIPEVHAVTTLGELIDTWPRDRRLFWLDETGGGRPIADVVPAYKGVPCGFLIGPEGGFAKSELDALRELPFVTALGLGPRILRAETAVVAALACWQAICGDWRSPIGADPSLDKTP